MFGILTLYLKTLNYPSSSESPPNSELLKWWRQEKLGVTTSKFEVDDYQNPCTTYQYGICDKFYTILLATASRAYRPTSESLTKSIILCIVLTEC